MYSNCERPERLFQKYAWNENRGCLWRRRHPYATSSTDTSTFANSELSCVTAEDKVSADLVAIFKPYVGPYNISQDYLSFLNSIGDQYFFRAKNEKSPKCGALILDGKIDSIRAQIGGQNLDVEQGAVEVTASVEIGKPANWIKIKLLVS